MKGRRGLFIFRRFFFFVLGLVVLFFVSSPNVLFSYLKKADKYHLFDFNWIEHESTEGSFIIEHIPPLVVILINQIIILLIDIICILENHETHSLYQKAYYHKTVIFLIVNMLIIPAWTLS